MAVTMKHLFEPVYTVDNWKEVIADSDKSIELLEQGYNPMRVKASDWIIKYETMRSIALKKLYELEQGLRVAANTLKDEDSNEELNGVRIPAGNVSGGIVHVNSQVEVAREELDEGGAKGVEGSQAVASHNEKIEVAAKEELGEGAREKVAADTVKELNEKVAEVAKLKLDERAVKGIEESRAVASHLKEIGNGAVKMDDKEGRALASHNERIEVACKEKLDKKALVEVAVRRDKTAQDVVDRTTDYEEMLISKVAGEVKGSDELNGRFIEVIPRAAKIEHVDEKSWDLALHLKEIGSGAVKIVENESQALVLHLKKSLDLVSQEEKTEKIVSNEAAARTAGLGVCHDVNCPPNVLWSRPGQVKLPSGERQAQRKSCGIVFPDSFPKSVNKPSIGVKENENEYREFASEEGVKRTAEVAANHIEETFGKSRVAGEPTEETDCEAIEEESKAVEHLKSPFEFGKVRTPRISKVSSELASRNLDSVEEEKVAGDTVNKLFNKNEKAAKIRREAKANADKLKLEQKLVNNTIPSKGFAIPKLGTAYTKPEFIKKGVGGSYLLEQRAKHPAQHKSDTFEKEQQFVSRHQARDLAKLKLPGTTYVERFIAGFGLSRLKDIDPRSNAEEGSRSFCAGIIGKLRLRVIIS